MKIGGDFIIQDFEEILVKLVAWQRNTLRFLVQSEEEYHEFMSFYEKEELIQYKNEKLNIAEGARVSEAMQKYRFERIKKMSLSLEDFKNSYNVNPIKALSELFQDGISKTNYKSINKRMLEGTTLEMLYEFHSLNPEEYFTRVCSRKIDEESLEFYRKMNQKTVEPYIEESDITVEDVKDFNGVSSTNHKVKGVYIQRMVRDTKKSKQIKVLYKDKCQLCRSKIKSTNGHVSEAHHIKPYNRTHKGDDTFLNLIVLCPNCHSRFDDYFYAIHPENKIVYCLDVNDENHLKEPYMSKGHSFGQKYLNYAWEIFMELSKSFK